MRQILSYVAQRFPLVVFVPAVLLLAGAAWAIAGAQSPLQLAHAGGLIAVLVAQFRLWDDLEDRDLDRLAHPDRILPRGPLGAFFALLAALVTVAFATFTATPPALAGLVVLDAMAWWAYRRLRPHVSDLAWRYGVLPIKYPAFVVLASIRLGSASPAPAAISALATYLCACAYEAWHSRTSSMRAAQ
jgi:hypothetical protein